MLTIVSDMLLTDSFLIKGNVENKYARLSQILDEHRRYFLKVRDATLIDLVTAERITTPLLHVNVEEILLGHEFLDGSSDPARRELATVDPRKLHRIRVFYTGNLNVEIGGHVRPGSYEVDDHASRRFFVMQNPVLRGFNTKGDKDLELLNRLEYAILNRLRLSYIYDFN